MAHLERPSTSCQNQRPSLADDETQSAFNRRNSVSRSYNIDNGPPSTPPRQPSQQPHQRLPKPVHASAPPVQAESQSNRLARNLLSNENWRQETMADVRVNAKAIEQSDQNILFGKGWFHSSFVLKTFDSA